MKAVFSQIQSSIYLSIFLIMRDIGSSNSDGFSAMEKRSHSSSRRSGNNSFITKRPIWQYWGRAQIPDLLDPPSHEPYVPMQVFGPTTLVNSQRKF